jgi:ABC-2 type transport system ATP-binding protein
MHRGALQAVGTPDELKSTVSPDATLEDVFRHYAASGLSEDSSGSTDSSGIRQIRSSRRVARNVG